MKMISEPIIEICMIIVFFAFIGIVVAVAHQHFEHIFDDSFIAQNVHVICTGYFNRMDSLVVLSRTVGPFLACFE